MGDGQVCSAEERLQVGRWPLQVKRRGNVKIKTWKPGHWIAATNLRSSSSSRSP